ncbi:MAG TPA: DNA-binding transcriptional regulator [Paludibacter sp.]
MIKILLLIDYSNEFSRGLLKGIIHYSKDFGPWTFYRLPPFYRNRYGTVGLIKWAKDWNADAIIAEWDTEGRSLLKELNMPVVLQNYRKRSDYFSNLTGDYYETGKMAARFFAQKGFRNFAFYGNKGIIWSMERAEGYRMEIEKTGGRYYYFDTESLDNDLWGKDHIQLNDWLLSLPKPIALFTCDDSFALQISEICKINNINIPNDISLLGVDNDELICNLSDPPISSIILDVEKGGYETGRLLHQLIKKEKNHPFNIVINPVRIVARLSTERYVISNKYIMKVVKYIEDNFATDISINVLTKLVPLSRRILEVKFKEELGTSIYQFIINYRIEYFAQLLLTTDKTLLDIALQSGFNDCKNISRTFKKFKNCTPNEYKQKFGFEFR